MAQPLDVSSPLPPKLKNIAKGAEAEVLAEMIGYLAAMLVDYPENVKVTVVLGEETTVLELHVGKVDFGKVIGKHGRTAQSLRTLLNAAATKLGKRVVLDIIEPNPAPQPVR